MRGMLLLVILGSMLALCACPASRQQAQERAAKQAIERAGASSPPAETGSGQGDVPVTTEPGGVEVGSKPAVVLPEGWPASLPAYPGAKITMGQHIGNGPTAALNIALETQDGPGDVLRFYDAKAKAAGFTNTMQVNAQDGGGMFQYKSETQVLTVSVSKGSTLTTATLALTGQ